MEELELSVSQFSRSVVSDSLWPHGLQYTRPPCPSPIPRVYSNSCPLSWWYHPTISSSIVPFSSHLQSFPASGSFPVSQFFASGGQSIGVSASASVLPMNIQDWLDFLAVQGTHRVVGVKWIFIKCLLFHFPFSYPYLHSDPSPQISFLTTLDLRLSSKH